MPSPAACLRRSRSLPCLRNLWSAFKVCRGGGVALVFGFALPVILLGAGVALDYAAWVKQGRKVQLAADAAALAAAKELTVANADKKRVEAVAKSVVLGELGGSDAEVGATLQDERSAVRVEVRQQVRALVSENFAPQLTSVRASATAALTGSRKLCLVALDPSAGAAVGLNESSQLAARDCDLQSNSTSPAGITLGGRARVSATRTCSTGGIAGGAGIRGEQLTDCPSLPDPFAQRPPPSVGPCVKQNKPLIDLGTRLIPHVLTPGTYCGGLTIGGASVVTFSPGVYVIKDGPLLIDGLAVVLGSYAGFYFTGDTGTSYVFRAAPNSVVDLTAPRSGPMAGMLFFEDRAAPALRSFEVLSNTARTLLGTLYMPKGRFLVDNNAIIADRSAYTVIVARRLELNGNPTLVLNANYNQTDVPVPKGVGPTGTTVRLVE